MLSELILLGTVAGLRQDVVLPSGDPVLREENGCQLEAPQQVTSQGRALVHHEDIDQQMGPKSYERNVSMTRHALDLVDEAGQKPMEMGCDGLLTGIRNGTFVNSCTPVPNSNPVTIETTEQATFTAALADTTSYVDSWIGSASSVVQSWWHKQNLVSTMLAIFIVATIIAAVFLLGIAIVFFFYPSKSLAERIPSYRSSPEHPSTSIQRQQPPLADAPPAPHWHARRS